VWAWLADRSSQSGARSGDHSAGHSGTHL
jgi:hypothetical protein